MIFLGQSKICFGYMKLGQYIKTMIERERRMGWGGGGGGGVMLNCHFGFGKDMQLKDGKLSDLRIMKYMIKLIIIKGGVYVGN